MSNTYGKNIKISIFGQSHSPEIGVTIEGLPAGTAIDIAELQAFMQRRMPGQGIHTTSRKEPDIPEFVAGLVDEITCDAPLTAIIKNIDIRSSDYDNLRDIPRPSHADYTAYIKFGDSHDNRGGGAFSGRMTAPMCIAGGICLQLLQKEGISVTAHIVQVGNVIAEKFDPVNVGEKECDALKTAAFPVLESTVGEKMLSAIEDARKTGDSLGGVIECAVIGQPAGIGDPMFEGIENRIASIIFGIPAVKGIEFGNGFASASLKGSENNDEFTVFNSLIKTKTNNHGGILGGITSGMPLIFRTAIKPTPSIAIPQDSVSLSRMEPVKLKIEGRHDPCIVPRAVPCIEAAAAIAIYDAFIDKLSEGRFS